jgi:hypothetical protein
MSNQCCSSGLWCVSVASLDNIALGRKLVDLASEDDVLLDHGRGGPPGLSNA